jgi:hypothetical protein
LTPGTFVLRFCSNTQFEPDGALALTVSRGDQRVQHILLNANTLEKESLHKLLARYPDCAFFYPAVPKASVPVIAREMGEAPGLAHYKQVGSAGPAAPTGGVKRSIEEAGFDRPPPRPLALPPDMDPSPAAHSPASAAAAAAEGPGVVVVVHEPAGQAPRRLRFHLSAGLTFRQLIPTALKLLRLPAPGQAAAAYAFQVDVLPLDLTID